MKTKHQLHNRRLKLFSNLPKEKHGKAISKLREEKKRLGRSLLQHEWEKIVADVRATPVRSLFA